MEELKINKIIHISIYLLAFFFCFLDSTLEFYGMKRNRIGHRLLFCINEYIYIFIAKSALHRLQVT